MSRNPAVAEGHRSWSPTVAVASVVPEVLEERPSLGNRPDQTECHILLPEQRTGIQFEVNTHTDSEKETLTMLGYSLFSGKWGARVCCSVQLNLHLLAGDFTNLCTLAFKSSSHTHSRICNSLWHVITQQNGTEMSLLLVNMFLIFNTHKS
jgi:hypothetical protein